MPDPAPHGDTECRLDHVTLTQGAPDRLGAAMQFDRAQAVADLEADNSFSLIGRTGPYRLHLSVQAGRLMLDVRDRQDAALTTIGLALGPFRKLIKDYELLLDSHEAAMLEGRDHRVQAIDMGRRGLHDEGANLLRQRLADKAEIDHDTARRLFTLLVALQHRT